MDHESLSALFLAIIKEKENYGGFSDKPTRLFDACISIPILVIQDDTLFSAEEIESELKICKITSGVLKMSRIVNGHYSEFLTHVVEFSALHELLKSIQLFGDEFGQLLRRLQNR